MFREEGLVARMSEYPGLYSLVIYFALSQLLIYLETPIGYKLASMSRSQTCLLIFAIVTVARNVFIPSRLQRFEKRKEMKQDRV